ncbi:hypothetical protein F8M49_01170 [Rhodococcus zopfii]|uniref:Uncharacterized protein n=1 Tax=Rhodococcus zopfii TaxID=43772 RepID=A0ABU3WK93_9NOCA|nr:hypothetical protein [Rhodococcus zopfii]
MSSARRCSRRWPTACGTHLRLCAVSDVELAEKLAQHRDLRLEGHIDLPTLMLDAARVGGHDPDRMSFVAAL